MMNRARSRALFGALSISLFVVGVIIWSSAEGVVATPVQPGLPGATTHSSASAPGPVGDQLAESSDSVELRANPSGLRVRVTTDSAAALPAAEVELLGLTELSPEAWMVEASVKLRRVGHTDAGGEVQFDDLDPDLVYRWRVRAGAPVSYSPRSLNDELRTDGSGGIRSEAWHPLSPFSGPLTLEPGEVALAEAVLATDETSVTGVIEDVEGRARAGVTVRLVAHDLARPWLPAGSAARRSAVSRNLEEASDVTTTSGRFRFDAVSAGKKEVTFVIHDDSGDVWLGSLGHVVELGRQYDLGSIRPSAATSVSVELRASIEGVPADLSEIYSESDPSELAVPVQVIMGGKSAGRPVLEQIQLVPGRVHRVHGLPTGELLLRARMADSLGRPADKLVEPAASDFKVEVSVPRAQPVFIELAHRRHARVLVRLHPSMPVVDAGAKLDIHIASAVTGFHVRRRESLDVRTKELELSVPPGRYTIFATTGRAGGLTSPRGGPATVEEGAAALWSGTALVQAVSGADTEVDLVLTPGSAELRGVVMSPDGTPQANRRFGLRPEWVPARAGWIFPIQTDAGGTFHLVSVPPEGALFNSIDPTQVIVAGPTGSVTEIAIVDSHHSPRSIR